MDHGQNVMERNIDFFAGIRISAELDGRAHNNRAIVVGRLLALASVPSQATTVCNNTGGDCSTVVPAPTNKHHPDLANFTFNFEVVDRFLGSCHILAITSLTDRSGAIGVFAPNFILGIDNVGRVDGE